jgi:hypothetical protein
MSEAQTAAQSNETDTQGVATVPRRTDVPVAHVNPKVVMWTVVTVVVVVAMSFVSIVVHGMILRGI